MLRLSPGRSRVAPRPRLRRLPRHHRIRAVSRGFDHARPVIRFAAGTRRSPVRPVTIEQGLGQASPVSTLRRLPRRRPRGTGDAGGRAADCADCHDERGFEFTTYTESRHADAPTPARRPPRRRVPEMPREEPAGGRAGIAGPRRDRPAARPRVLPRLPSRAARARSWLVAPTAGPASPATASRAGSRVPTPSPITPRSDSISWSGTPRSSARRVTPSRSGWPWTRAARPATSIPTMAASPTRGSGALVGPRGLPRLSKVPPLNRKRRPAPDLRLPAGGAAPPDGPLPGMPRAELDAPPLPSTLRTDRTRAAPDHAGVPARPALHGLSPSVSCRRVRRGRIYGGDCQGCHVSHSLFPACVSCFDHARDSRVRRRRRSRHRFGADRCHPVPGRTRKVKTTRFIGHWLSAAKIVIAGSPQEGLVFVLAPRRSRSRQGRGADDA